MITEFKPRAHSDAHDIPIVGQPFELVQWYPTVIITCKCSTPPTVVTIIGMGDGVCKSCGRPWNLAQLNYDRAKSEVHINLGCGAPMVKPELDK